MGPLNQGRCKTLDFDGSREVKQRIVGEWESLHLMFEKSNVFLNGLDQEAEETSHCVPVRFDPMSGFYLPGFDFVWLD